MYCGKFATILGVKTSILMSKLTKVAVTHYKMWNEVILWFTQMMCYHVYVPLLMRQMNDVEENLNPEIFDVPDSTVIFCKLEHA